MATRHRICLTAGRVAHIFKHDPRHTLHMNIGMDRRGTAILAKDGLALSDIQRLPSGRGMSAQFRGILLVIIYASSGAEKRQERETFCNTEVVHMIPPSCTAMILAGDFVL